MHLDCDHQATSWRSNFLECQHFGRFDGGISFIMHHPKPAAVSQRSQSIRLGAQSSGGYEGDASRWFAPPALRLMLCDFFFYKIFNFIVETCIHQSSVLYNQIAPQEHARKQLGGLSLGITPKRMGLLNTLRNCSGLWIMIMMLHIKMVADVESFGIVAWAGSRG